MINKVFNLLKWLNNNNFCQEAFNLNRLIKSASLNKDKLFRRYSKLEYMAQVGSESSDSAIRNEANSAGRRLQEIVKKFELETGLNFAEEYREWSKESSPQNNPNNSGASYSPYNEPEKSVYKKYDWRNYHDEIDDILRNLGYDFSEPGISSPKTSPTPGQFDQRLDHIVRDYLNGTLTETEANRLLGEDDSEWLNEMTREMKAEMMMTGEWAAEQREAQRVSELGTNYWMSPMEQLEAEDAAYYSDWKNHIEAEGVSWLLETLNHSDKDNDNTRALSQRDRESLVRIQKDSYSPAVMVKKEDLLQPNETRPEAYFYGVTKLEYAKEYMEKQLDRVIFPEGYSSFDEEMNDLVDETGNLFFKFQNNESSNSPGNNDLADHLREHLNNIGANYMNKVARLINWVWKDIQPRRNSKTIRLRKENYLDEYPQEAPKLMILNRYLDDVEEESAGRRFHPLYKKFLKNKYSYIYMINDAAKIYNEILEFAIDLSEKNLEFKQAKLSWLLLLRDLTSKYPEVFKLKELQSSSITKEHDYLFRGLEDGSS